MSTIQSRAAVFQKLAANTTASDRLIANGRTATAASMATGKWQLPTFDLMRASMHHSKNPVIQLIWNEVTRFNAESKAPATLTPAQAHGLLLRLDAIMYYAAGYLISKWVKSAAPSCKRNLRYHELSSLLGHAAKFLALLGVKGLTGPNDWTAISDTNRSYWLERIDLQRHRVGFVLSPLYEAWQQKKPANAFGKPQPFFDWLETEDAQKVIVKESLVADAKKSVAYDPAGEPLWKKEVYFDGGQLKKVSNDDAFHTGTRASHKDSSVWKPARETCAGGSGWAIFVCSFPAPPAFRQRIFSYSHVLGEFHHSSFLSGAPTASAGEWVVDNGVVKVVTAKSGHYTPGVDELHRFVTTFTDIPSTAIIRPNVLDVTQGAKKILYYRVGDFRTLKLGATFLKRDQVLAAIPTWADRLFAVNLPT